MMTQVTKLFLDHLHTIRINSLQTKGRNLIIDTLIPC